MNQDYEILQSAIHLPTHEEAIDVFKTVNNINASYKNTGHNILHHYINSYSYDSNKHLRIKDFYTLVQLGVDVNSHSMEGQTPLQYCCNTINYEAAKILIENGAEIDSVDNWGRTPLFVAIMDYRGQKDLLKLILLLLEKGANLDKPVNSGKTPRDVAKMVQRMFLRGHPNSTKEWDLSAYIKLD